MSAAAEAWAEEALAVPAGAVPERREDDRHDERAGGNLRPVGDLSGGEALVEASPPTGWNVLTETLVEFPRPSCKPFLDPDETTGDQTGRPGRGYGQQWLERELSQLRVRTSDVYYGRGDGLAGVRPDLTPRALSDRGLQPSRRLSQPSRSLRGPALARALDLADDPSLELSATLDTFLSPNPVRRARVARVAAPPRTRAALPRPRGLRRLLPGAATLVVLASLLGGAAALTGGRSDPTAVIPGSVRLPSGGYAYVVHPGDTLWTIASRLRPGGDPRPLVAQLQNQLHGSTLEPGDSLVLP